MKPPAAALVKDGRYLGVLNLQLWIPARHQHCSWVHRTCSAQMTISNDDRKAIHHATICLHATSRLQPFVPPPI